ncbi:hypothetical protein A3K72_00330 [Candidatus Woesearchaeota archaeon RBG_13_36_6]|nr:MAG: hypothetical protein A3K72_00330 [Candidatus Woesearchaeota archaeon RBG_13_36_6]
MKTMKCECGGKYKETKYYDEAGFIVDCFKCDKCKEIIFSEKQTEDFIRLRDLNKKIQSKRKIIKVGSSIASLLPKKIQDAGIKEGLVSDIRILSKRSLELRFDKDLF